MVYIAAYQPLHAVTVLVFFFPGQEHLGKLGYCILILKFKTVIFQTIVETNCPAPLVREGERLPVDRLTP